MSNLKGILSNLSYFENQNFLKEVETDELVKRERFILKRSFDYLNKINNKQNIPAQAIKFFYVNEVVVDNMLSKTKPANNKIETSVPETLRLKYLFTIKNHLFLKVNFHQSPNTYIVVYERIRNYTKSKYIDEDLQRLAHYLSSSKVYLDENDNK